MTSKQIMLVWITALIAVAIVLGLLGLAVVVRTASVAKRNGQDDAIWSQCISAGFQVINGNCIK